MFMVLAAALLSTFLTNDVALFIVVPLTITLKRLCEIPVNRLIIFEALAVNAGSLLTPIGNRKIFLSGDVLVFRLPDLLPKWHRWLAQ